MRRSARIHVFVNASDMQLAHQLQKTRAQVARMAAAMVRSAREFTDDVEFSPMDATRADPAFLAELVRAVLAAGARHDQSARYGRLRAAGAGGRDDPHAAQRRAGARRTPCSPSTARTTSASPPRTALAAIAAGARQVEVTVNAIGERAGNTSLEEVVLALRVHGERLGVRHGRGHHGHLLALGAGRRRARASPCRANKAIVGRNAFRHASGIHQDGVLKQRETYEVIDPAWIGHPIGSEIVLGKLSGRAGFASRVAALGIVLSEAELESAFRRFQRVAAVSREVNDAELRLLLVPTLAPLAARGADAPLAG